MSAAKTATPAAALEEVRWTSPWKLFLAIAATFAAMFALAVALPHDPYIRYQQLSKTLQFRSQWIYERTALDKTPIDIAIVGNSRLAAGISGPQIQAILGKDTGRPIHVANLSMPQEGRNMHYAIVKRLLEDHPEVRLIILSAIEQMPREGHPAFRDLADASDVLGAPKLINPGYAGDVSVLPYRQISLFAQSLAPRLFGDRVTLDRAAYPGTDFDSTKTFRLPDGQLIDRDSIPDPVKLAASADARLRSPTPRLLPEHFADYEFAIERTYTRKIAELARTHGVKLMFVALPIYSDTSPVRDAAFYEQFGPVFRPDFVDGDFRLYSDYAHVNVRGTRLVSAWVAKQIEAQGYEDGAVR
jgi:hypothetical protein